jgi:aminoglycoside phosphotransferase family enzyme/predicted kinase
VGEHDYIVASETHSAVILLVGDQALKFKKPVDLGFLDFSSLEQRHRACEREVELNRRIAPDVYRGLARLVGVDGEICEYLVAMRRMPAERRLSTLVTAGEPVDAHLKQIARTVAAFHATARRAPEITTQGSRDAIRRRWTDSFEQLRSLEPLALPRELIDEIETHTLQFLDGREELFDARMAEGRVVDGHGDLLTDDIYCLADGPRILDCIEFDDTLRFVDQLDDAAFLAMDLEYLGAPDLAHRYLDWYAEFSADPAPAALRHHYLAYRAFVRAKVACVRFSQGSSAARDVADRLAQLTMEHLWASAVSMTVVGGFPGTGKSTLSTALADAVGAVVVSTDRVRKELAGLAPDEPAPASYGEGMYTSEWTERVYAEVLHRARQLLGRGERVIVDASWTARRDREHARRIARATRSPIVELRCSAPAEVTGVRIRTRTNAVSDADAAIAAAMAAGADPWPEATVIDTTQDLTASLAEAIEAVNAVQVVRSRT